MMKDNFYKKLKKPIVGMAPMDGVTDAAMRYMVSKHSKPSFVMTEFTNVEGLARGAVKMMPAFLYDEIERPIVAQLFGVEVLSFYKAAVMLCELGFDGIDINMGCPIQKIAKKGSGAALIRTPELARGIIRSVKKGVDDWAGGISMKKAGVHENIIKEVEKMRHGKAKRRVIPVSVKTRIGYDEVAYEQWMEQLLEEKPDAIFMHGRTLKQLYRGEADWEILGKAAKICKGSGTLFFGNGDVKSMKDAVEKIKKYDLDGVIVGRAVQGNPWFFGGKEPSLKRKKTAAIEHCEYFVKIFGGKKLFCHLKKHLAWYIKGFEGASELRMRLMGAENLSDVRKILKF
ncbi:MAG: tRNA-dihydrouridine synthase [Candidatus Peregrinibacteria bacterium]